MTFHCTFQAELASYIVPFQSTETTRYYLNGFFVEPCLTGGVTLTATDGHVLLSIRDPLGECEGSAIVFLPKSFLQVCKPDKGDGEHTRVVVVEGDNARVTLSGGATGGVVNYAHQPNVIVDGTYPDWRHTIPSQYDNKPATYNYATLARFVALAKKLRCALAIATNGEDPAAIRFDCFDLDAFGVIMPFRSKLKIKVEVPVWIGHAAPKQTKD